MLKKNNRIIKKGDRIVARFGGRKNIGTAIGVSRPTKEGPRWIYVQWDNCNYGDVSPADAILEIDVSRA